jgi:hypothetical protein
VAADLEVVGRGQVLEQVLDVAPQQILGGPAIHAQEVVVMPPVAKLVVESAVFEKDPAEDPGPHQQFQGAVNGGPAHLRQLAPNLLSGEVTLLGGDGFGHSPAG